MFSFHSPCPEQGMGDEFNLMDHSDLYILDFSKYPCHNQCLIRWLDLFHFADADIQSDA